MDEIASPPPEDKGDLSIILEEAEKAINILHMWYVSEIVLQLLHSCNLHVRLLSWV